MNPYHGWVQPPAGGEVWVGLSADPLPVERAREWVVRPDCGGVVVFVGTVRDHAEGRSGVTALEYEAYEEQAVPRLQAVADEVKERWAEVGRVALLHRVGALDLTDVAVVVAVSAGHREEAFAAARWAIDTLKATVPIWKRETWSGGEDWGTNASPVRPVREVS